MRINIDKKLEDSKKPMLERALCVGRSFMLRNGKNNNVVHEHVLVSIDMENNEYRLSVEKYTASMTVAKRLLEEGLIDNEDYEKINSKFMKKYGIKKGSILTLIS